MRFKKKILGVVLVLGLVLTMVLPVLASSYGYTTSLIITEAGGSDKTLIPVLVDLDNQSLVDYGYLDPDGLDTRMQEAEDDRPYSVIDSKLGLLVPNLTSYQSKELLYYTTYDPDASDFDVVVGTPGGYITIPDDATLELDSDFEIEQKGYIDTSNPGITSNLVNKRSAAGVSITDTGEISGLIYYEEPVELVPSGYGAWTDVDVSEYVPGYATGIVLHLVGSAAGVKTLGVRINGSVDELKEWITEHAWTIVGIDNNDIVELYLQDDATHVYLTGFTGSDFTFKTSADDISLDAATAWTEIDVSAEAPNATGVIVVAINSGGASPALGARKLGSGDSRTQTIAASRITWFTVGVDADQKLEGYIGTLDLDFYLVGYTTANVTFLTDGIDKSFVGDFGSWEELDLSGDVPTTATHVIFEVQEATGAQRDYGFRRKGSTEDIHISLYSHAWAIVELGEDRIVEAWAETANVNWWLVGYTEGYISNPIERQVTAPGISSSEYTVKTYGVANEPEGATGDVLHFDGTVNSQIDSGVIYNAQAKLWISLWFKLDNIHDAASADGFLWNKTIDANDFMILHLQAGSGVLRFAKKVGGGDVFSLVTPQVSWAADTWYHVIISISSVNGARMIVDNGVALTDADVTAAPNGGNFRIGSYAPHAWTPPVGDIQNVIVGIDDLTTAEEAALFAGTAPGDEDNYWYLDEGTGRVAYDSAGTDDGTIDAAPSWETATYVSGESLRFSGSAYSNVNFGAIHSASDKLWLSFWFKLDEDHGVGEGDKYLWGKYLNGTDYIILALRNDTGKILFWGVTGGVTDFDLQTTTTSWNAGQWYHVLVSLSDTTGGIQRLLIDNGLEDSNTHAAVNTPNGGDFIIGDYDDPGDTRGFIGEIKEVVVGVGDLTEAEEDGLYAGTLPDAYTEYYPMDEGYGTTIYDQEGTNDHDGTIDLGCTWFHTGRLSDFYIQVDSDRWGTNLKGASVPDNSNDWILNQNDVMSSMEYYKHTTTEVGLTETLAPSGAGAETNIPTLVGAASNWQANLTNDGDTSYVKSSNTNAWERDLYATENSDIGSGSITSVTVYFVAKRSGASAYGMTAIRTNGTTYDGDSETLNADGQYHSYSTTYTDNPQSGGAWTWAEVDAMQVGVSLKGNGVFGLSTQVYAIVTYNTAERILQAWYQPNYIIQDTALIDRSYYGLDFDGTNDRVDLGNPASLQLTGAMTIEGWVLFTDATNVRDNVLYGKHTGAPQRGFLLGTSAGSNTFKFQVSSNGTAVTHRISDTAVFIMDTWYHIVGVYSPNTNLDIYINGSLDNGVLTGAIPASIHNSTTDIRLGAHSAGAWWKGSIDEVRIYNRALGINEINANFNSGVGSYTPDDTSGLVGWWHMEEGVGDGAILIDSSGEGNTGDIDGAAWTTGKVPRPAGNSGTNDAVITYGGRFDDSGSIVTLTDSQLTQADDFWNDYILKIKETTDGNAPEGEESEITDFTSATLGGTADSGTGTTVVDTELIQPTAYWAGATVTIVTTTDSGAPQGESKTVTTWDLGTNTLTFPAMTAAVDTGDTYTLTAADTLFFEALTAAVEAGDRYEIWDGQTILWGSFPEGVKVRIGPLVAFTDPVSSAAGLEAPEVVEAPPEPSGIFGGAATVDLPMYPLFNTVAAQLDWSTDVLYVIVWMILSIGMGLALLLMTGSTLGAIAGVSVGMVGGMATGMLPVWILLVYMVLAITWLYVSRSM